MKMIEKITEYIAILLMFLLTFFITVQIISRLFRWSFTWITELSVFTWVALAFIGGAFAYFKGEGFQITSLIDRFPPTLRKINDIVISVLTMLMLLIILYFSFSYFIKIWGTPTPGLNWNKALIYLVVPVGYMLILIKSLKDFKKILTSHN